MIFNEDVYDEDGFNKEGFDRYRFNRKGVDQHGYNRNGELACKEKLKEARKGDTNKYKYATSLRLKYNVGIAKFFIEQNGPFALINKTSSEKQRHCYESSWKKIRSVINLSLMI